MRTLILATLAAAGLSACVAVEPATAPAPVAPQNVPPPISSGAANSNFQAAVRRVEPAAETLCRQRAQAANCDFLIRIHPDPNAPPNAFQSLDPRGRPILTFTRSLIAETRNQDEIAFVIGHESAHHIEQHIARQQRSASTGALVGGLIASVAGADTATANEISRISAGVGARRFSKDHELEADALGTIITSRAGYDPVRGAAFFTRIPDPGDRFLGTHPPNASRIDVVRRTAAGL
ncbi:M48 family metallopeptidase [Jannaschia rubra]|uniref:TPR repeat-containing protein YfgC n=1 Tax=Jannaschia rubra TaxID=282197 RepID=A0A0M6XRL9_9RHOB|nr:M48 family metallopeptidase [Jannaschia rubra]CTQ33786.1 TPR repeat-containing protein YfgC precursor [Jannaschia rubra]SFG09006.1 Peptidase family M48 [Jannaschia rubra]